MPYPEAYRYTREHEWIHVTDGVGRVGITDHAQETLGDIVFVELPKTGTAVSKSDTFGSVESVKAVSDLYAPVSGEVTAVNDELAQAPEKINTGAHDAWIMELKISDPAELDQLLTAQDYEAFVAQEK